MTQENPDELLDKALDGVNLSKIDKERGEEYTPIPPNEISEAYEEYPLRGYLMRLANEVLNDARSQAEGTKKRKKQYHEMGWNLAIETSQGMVGLWSCWLGDRFYLGYPKRTQSIVDSIDPKVVIELGYKLRSDAYMREYKNIPDFVKEPMSYDEAKLWLVKFSHSELTEMLEKNKIPLTNSSDIPVTDELIIKTLGVERARHVRQVNATAVNDWNYEGMFADKDKPLKQTECGQIIGYQDVGNRLWAKFYGPSEPTGGRVWVDHSDFESNGIHFSYIKDDELRELYYGHDQSNGISTFQFSFYNEYTPEGPTSDPKAIQKYKDKFIQLASEIAFIMGGPKGINLDYKFVLVPEDLYREGYKDITWLKGSYGERKGWGEEVVRARKGDSTVILKSGNSLVPWSTTLYAPASKLTAPDMLADFIKEDILWF